MSKYLQHFTVTIEGIDDPRMITLFKLNNDKTILMAFSGSNIHKIKIDSVISTLLEKEDSAPQVLPFQFMGNEEKICAINHYNYRVLLAISLKI